MSERKFKFELTWENNNFFQMTFKNDEEGNIIVIRVDENATLQEIRNHVEEICKYHFNKFLGTALDEMKG